MILHDNVENAIEDATAYAASLAVEIAHTERCAIQAVAIAVRLRFAQEGRLIEHGEHVDVASKILRLAVIAGANGPESAGETIKQEIEKIVSPGADTP